MNKCANCFSYAINEDAHGRIRGVDPDLCDVCYWRKRAEGMESHIAIALEQARLARSKCADLWGTDRHLDSVIEQLTAALAKIKGE